MERIALRIIAPVRPSWHEAERASALTAADGVLTERPSGDKLILSLGRHSKSSIALGWLFPEPELWVGEAIELEDQSQVATGTRTPLTGMLFLTTRDLVYVPGRGTRKSRATVLRSARSDFARVTLLQDEQLSHRSQNRLWHLMRLELANGLGTTFAVMRAGEAVALLQQALGRG